MIKKTSVGEEVESQGSKQVKYWASVGMCPIEQDVALSEGTKSGNEPEPTPPTYGLPANTDDKTNSQRTVLPVLSTPAHSGLCTNPQLYFRHCTAVHSPPGIVLLFTGDSLCCGMAGLYNVMY